MNIEYRKATAEDIKNLVSTRLNFLSEVNNLTDEDRELLKETNHSYFIKAIRDGSYVSYIALEQNQIVGTSGITFYSVPPNKKCPTGKAAYISNIYTCSDYRGKGIARNLFTLVVDEARKSGYEKLLLNATDMGRPLYEKFGFSATHGDMEYIIRNS